MDKNVSNNRLEMLNLIFKITALRLQLNQELAEYTFQDQDKNTLQFMATQIVLLY